MRHLREADRKGKRQRVLGNEFDKHMRKTGSALDALPVFVVPVFARA